MSLDRKALFLEILKQEGLALNDDLNDDLKRIAAAHTSDLSPTSSRHFSEDLEKFVTEKSARSLGQRLSLTPGLAPAVAWLEIVTDFHRTQQWGLATTVNRPVRVKEDTPAREVASYVWTLIQALLVMKCVILFFGIKSAEDPSPWMTAGLIIALAFSFGSLMYFAIRKSRKEALKKKSL
ncbi:MAG: hypothetical protein ACK5P7_07350 [Bdellovibrio sp.]